MPPKTMTDAIHIRPGTAADEPRIAQLYALAFPDENLLPLVRDLLQMPTGLLSLVGEIEGRLAGHAAFTLCAVDGDPSPAALLGPLAVAPEVQKQGFGSGLVREGLARLAQSGIGSVFVLGDPRYYARFGFTADPRVKPPYALPEAWRGAWQSLRLDASASAAGTRLNVPAPWRRAALWSP